MKVCAYQLLSTHLKADFLEDASTCLFCQSEMEFVTWSVSS